MKKFHLPDFFIFYDLNYYICELFKTKREYFIDDMEIGSVYGSYPCYWNGGRDTYGYVKTSDMAAEMASFNALNVPIRFTFTNMLIDEHLIHDPLGNSLMEMANNGMNEVLVNSDILENYLREKYPNFKYISSTTKCLLDADKVNAECKKYDLVVLDYRENRNDIFIDKIEDKKKIEILCNAYCSPACPHRKEHYMFNSYFNLRIPEKYSGKVNGCIPGDYAKTFWEAIKSPVAVVNDDHRDKYSLSYYESLGIENFKIEGRGNNIMDVIDSYMYYMVKAEYRDIVRNLILRNCRIIFMHD